MCPARRFSKPNRSVGFIWGAGFIPRGALAPLLLLLLMPLQAQPPTEGITRELAQSRAKQISDLHYQLSLELSTDTNEVPGREEITLVLATAADPVILDFRDASIANLTVNGAPAESQSTNGHLIIPSRYF